MNHPEPFIPERRRFITAMPLCALACLGCGEAAASDRAAEGPDDAQDTVHKFDKEFDQKLTYRHLFAMQHRGTIQLAKDLSADLGKEKVIELMKKYTHKNLLEYGRRQAKQMGDNSFAAYVNTFRGGYESSLTLEIVEDTPKAFELKVTECLWATTFRQANAGDIGVAAVCHGDYAWAEGFNPKIKMIRDKTLMEGHACCNHRYVWTG